MICIYKNRYSRLILGYIQCIQLFAGDLLFFFFLSNCLQYTLGLDSCLLETDTLRLVTEIAHCVSEWTGFVAVVVAAVS